MRRLYSILFLLGSALPVQLTADVALTELAPPPIGAFEAIPKNIARWNMEALLLVADGDRGYTTVNHQMYLTNPEAQLLSEDAAVGYSLETGRTVFVIDCAQDYIVNDFIVHSYGATGSVEVSIAPVKLGPGSWRWEELGDPLPLIEGEETEVPLAEAIGRYVRIVFDITTAGEIGSFYLMGQVSVADVQFTGRQTDASVVDVPSESNETVAFDYASLYANSLVSHVSSGDLVSATNMIDDDIRTYYSFSPDDNNAALVLDLSTAVEFNRIAVNFAASSGRLDIYYFNELPGEWEEEEMAFNVQDLQIDESAFVGRQSEMESFGGVGSRRLQVVDEFFEDNRPAFSEVITEDSDRVRLTFDTTLGRFILFHWVPDTPDQGDFSTLRIYEISIIGEIDYEDVVLARPFLTAELGTVTELNPGEVPQEVIPDPIVVPASP